MPPVALLLLGAATEMSEESIFKFANTATKSVKLFVKMIAMLDHILRPIKLIVRIASKVNFKIKTINLVAETIAMPVRILLRRKQLVLNAAKDNGKIKTIKRRASNVLKAKL